MKKKFDLKAQKEEELAILTDIALCNNKDFKTRRIFELTIEARIFLEQFNLDRKNIMNTRSLILDYLINCDKIPRKQIPIYVAAYFIISKHPLSFPNHENIKTFCDTFNVALNPVKKSVLKMKKVLNIIEIRDEKNFPYFIVPGYIDLILTQSIVKEEVEKSVLDYLLFDKPINKQIITEKLVSKIVFEIKLFPEELFRQIYEIIYKFVNNLIDKDYKDLESYNSNKHLIKDFLFKEFV